MFNRQGFLVTIDIQKTVNSVNHNFLIMILEKSWFWNYIHSMN